jgi:hypothetical protein
MEKLKSFRFSWTPKYNEADGTIVSSRGHLITSRTTAAAASADASKGSQLSPASNSKPPTTMLDSKWKPKKEGGGGVKFGATTEYDDTASQMSDTSDLSDLSNLDDGSLDGSVDSRNSSPNRLMRKYSVRTAKFLKAEALDIEEESRCIKHLTDEVTEETSDQQGDDSALRALLPKTITLDSSQRQKVELLFASFRKWQAELEAGLKLQQQLMESKNRRQIRAMKYSHSVNQGSHKVRRHVTIQKEEITVLKEELDENVNDGLVTSTMLDRVSWQYKALKSQFYHEIIPSHAVGTSVSKSVGAAVFPPSTALPDLGVDTVEEEVQLGLLRGKS